MILIIAKLVHRKTFLMDADYLFDEGMFCLLDKSFAALFSFLFLFLFLFLFCFSSFFEISYKIITFLANGIFVCGNFWAKSPTFLKYYVCTRFSTRDFVFGQTCFLFCNLFEFRISKFSNY